MLHELAFFAHAGGELPAYALDGTPEHATVVKLALIKPMLTKGVSLGFENFGKL
jgi:hypothetical protein